MTPDNEGQANVAHPVCDYEGSPYSRVFWEDADRSYEDAAERLAVRALLPPGGGRLLDVGAGFGRLASEYGGYDEVVLLDYAFSMLAEARARLGDAFTYVCADLYSLPLAAASLDSVVQVRVLHHVARIDAALAEVARCLRPGGAFVLEFANKRNLKALLRYALGHQQENPLSQEPYEFVPLNWDFHPRHVEWALRQAGLDVRQRRAVSLFREPHVKRLVPAAPLARLDSLFGRRLGRLSPGPSQFLLCQRHGCSPAEAGLWCCPACHHQELGRTSEGLRCATCGRQWPIVEGIYVFREGVTTTQSTG